MKQKISPCSAAEIFYPLSSRQTKNKSSSYFLLAAQYTKYTFSMFGGEPETVNIVFQNRMMGVVMDRFGSDIVAMKEENPHFRISVAVSQQFFVWVFGLGKEVRIIAHKSMKE